MLSAQQQVEEYTKCVLNPVYAIENYLETFDKTQEGFVPFHLFEKQLEIISGYEEHRFNIIAKPRQAGVSTTTAAYASVKTGFADPNNPEKVLILANKQDMAQEFLGKIKDFLNQLPRWLWGPDYYGTPEKESKSIFVKESMKHLILPNKSEIKAVATSKDALRGYTPTHLIMDEAAFIDDGEIVFGAALTSLGTGGHATLISTPNGYDKLYYKTYDGAQTGDNDFNIIEMRWYQDPRYNKGLTWTKDDVEEIESDFTVKWLNKRVSDGWKPNSPWYTEMCRGMNNDKRMIAQELDVSFVGSGGNVIDEEHVKFQEDQFVEPPKWVDDKIKELWIWAQPVEDHKYLLSSDVSRGDGDDFSTFAIIDITTMEQVVEYRGKVQPDLLAPIIDEYASRYNAYTVVDITGGLGVVTVLKLLEIGFKNLHYDDPRNKILSSRADLQKFSKDNGKKIPGLNVNSIRLPMVAQFEESIREVKIKIKSRRMISEMRTFVYRNGRPDHMPGYHDDLIMAIAMGLWVLEYSFKSIEKLNKQTKAMLNSWQISSPEISNTDEPAPFVSKDKKVIKGKPNFDPIVSKNMQDPTGEFLWLFSGLV